MYIIEDFDNIHDFLLHEASRSQRVFLKLKLGGQVYKHIQFFLLKFHIISKVSFFSRAIDITLNRSKSCI